MDYALPVVFAIAAWWTSTVVLIYRAGLDKQTYPMTLAATTVVALLGVLLLVMTRNAASPAAPYLAFLGALSLWAWHEVSYLFGFVSGPRPEACPPDATGWRRFLFGIRASIYHELAIVATAVLLAFVTFDASNRVGLWTFVVLWLMRWSAKLNIFLGVRNLHEEFWPDHLSYLSSFTRTRNMNELFPWSIAAAAVGLLGLIIAAATAGEDTLQRTAAVLVATILALAMLEHCLLMLKVRDEMLWLPGLRSRRSDGAAAG
ncbi:MAG: putative photosynthetic complex assembly protein PuhE [Pseudomonadota bacterium]